MVCDVVFVIKSFEVGKVIKKSVKIFLVVVLLLLAVPTTIWLVVQSSSVQTKLVNKVTSILESKLGTEVSIEKFDYRPFNRVLLRNILIKDLRGDTLMSAETLTASLLRFSNSKRFMNLHRVTLDNAYINFATDSTGEMNLKEFLDLFITKKEKKDDDAFIISIKHARIKESNFRLFNESFEPVEPAKHTVDFKDLMLSSLNIDVRNMTITGDTIGFIINEMSFKEKSGLQIDLFRSDLSFSRQHMDFDRLRVRGMDTQLNMVYFRMSYSDWSDMGNFIEEVRLNGLLDNSIITTRFLSYVVPGIHHFDEEVSIEGRFRGTVSDFRLRDLKVFAAESTVLHVNANVTGLPDIDNTFMFIDFNQLSSTVNDIESISKPNSSEPLVDIPDDFYTLEEISYVGNFTGFITDFVAFGTLNSAIGNISMDLSFKPDKDANTRFKGQVSTRNLDLGRLIGDQVLGKTSFSATVEGSTDYANHLEALTDATIYSIEANGYNYTNIDLSGNLSSRTFVGSLFLDDPNAKLNFMGKVDLSDTIPVFDFSAFVPKLDLVKLNLNETDSISQASFLLTAKLSGYNLDNSQGEIKVVNALYRNQNGEIKTSDITVTADNTLDSKHIALKSEFAEGDLRGKYNYANIFNSFRQLVYLYIPALSPDNQKPEIQPTGVENPEYNDYIIRLRVRKTAKLTEVLFPNFRIAENTNVFGIYNPDFQTLTLKVMIPELEMGGNVIKSVSIDGQTSDTSFVASITTPHFDFEGSFVKNIAVVAEASNNNITTSLSWDNRTVVKNQGSVVASTKFEHKQDYNKISIKFNPSQFYLNDTIWNVMPSEIIIDSNHVAISNFSLQNHVQKLNINGLIASTPQDSIRVNLENIDISNVNVYTRNLGYEFKGKIDGYAKVTDVTNNPLFYSDLLVDNIEINDQQMGNLSFTSRWFAEDKRLSIIALNKLQDVNTFTASGDFYPETQKLSFKVNIDNFLLNHIEPLLDGEVHGLEGNISGNLAITGTTTTPIVNGALNINNALATIDFTRTRYSITDQIVFENSNIVFRNFRVSDVNNRLATINGSIRTNHFKDISFDLNLQPSNFQFLNTTERDNNLFYGTVFTSGQVRVTGKPNNMIVNASVRTEPRTAIYLPLSSSGDVAEHDFVTFINRDSEIIIIEDLMGVEDAPKSNISLTLDMQVTPEAEVQIIIDKQMGDIIRANGSGNLKMEINPSEDIFNMFGEYVIERGDYLFTLQGVINKRFRIGEGSTITWNGDVEDAMMDIKAIYTLRTSLEPLAGQGTTNPNFSRRTQVDCHINITGKLMEPLIDFAIEVPLADTDPDLQAVVERVNNEENINVQFLSLLVINSFYDGQQTGGDLGQGLAASTVGDLLSNQLSNWLSQWSNNLDIGLNYRPGDEISSQEIELALSTQLFNDRVTITSNVDMASQNPNAPPIAGDFSIDVKIVPSGKLRVKAFARSNDDILYGPTQSETYTTGAGIMYREDFNSLGELWTRYKRIFSRNKEEPMGYRYPYENGNGNGSDTSQSSNKEANNKNPLVEIK